MTVAERIADARAKLARYEAAGVMWAEEAEMMRKRIARLERKGK